MSQAPGRGRLLLVLALVLVAAAPVAARDPRPPSKLAPKLRSQLAAISSAEPVLVWVRFTDKGPRSKATLSPNLVSARCLQRRAKVLPASDLVGTTDLPVEPRYIEQVRAQVERIRQRTKWFNGVSAVATRAQIDAVAALPCVHSIELVTRYARRATIEPPSDVQPPPHGKASTPRTRHVIDYGRSLAQLELMHVPALHDRGITGTGVLVGHFDNGYRLLSHHALASLHIVATHDFVDGDVDPAPNSGDPDTFGAHGIGTLSVLAGNAPGELVGPAFDADFVLARTENDASETPLEEDNWVAAIEWADSLGIDVASTSLGYSDFDAGFTSLTWQDMNGNTALITRAADMAVARGIAVFNAAGNGGDALGGRGNTLVAPADGDSVVTVGGVGASGTRYPTSSVGPTANQPPRIKPDVMAQGGAVYIAGTGSTTEFGYNAGTSFACPLAAGVAVLLLSQHPNATPMQIRDALRTTATRAANPDNFYGWGIVDATAALDRLQSAVHSTSWTSVKGSYR